MSVCLPGDLVTGFSQLDRQIIQKHEDYYSTTVLGKMKDGNFDIIKKCTVPQVHDIVIGKVIRSKRKEVHIALLMANDIPLISPLLAELRSVDIQEKNVDSVVASDVCKPGDLIKARVVALGRSGFYAQVSTAEEGLGVVKLEKGQ